MRIFQTLPATRRSLSEYSKPFLQPAGTSRNFPNPPCNPQEPLGIFQTLPATRRGISELSKPFLQTAGRYFNPKIGEKQ